MPPSTTTVFGRSWWRGKGGRGEALKEAKKMRAAGLPDAFVACIAPPQVQTSRYPGARPHARSMIPQSMLWEHNAFVTPFQTLRFSVH